MITLRNITLQRGQSILLSDINWTIHAQQRIGLIGKNGAGKSSLFALLMGKLHADQGDLDISRELKIAHVEQETPGLQTSALHYVLQGDAELSHLQEQLAHAEQLNDGTQIAILHDALSKIDAYTAPARAAQLLAGLGFSTGEQQKSVAEFSGGWRVRLNLAKALMCRSDILLLDEPTNHLDLDAVLWLEQWLIHYQGTLLIISHDRDFLDRTINIIAYLAHQTIELYKGNYSDFERQRAAQLELQQATYEKQQKHVAHLRSFVDRFRAKASKARQAQSRLKAIEKLDLVAAVQKESPFYFEFKKPKQCPNPLLVIDDAQIRYGEKIILDHIQFSIAPKERVAILGPNGAGKTSLIKLLAGEIHPSRGTREASPGLKIGYFAQHQVDHLHLSESPLQHLERLAQNETPVELRKYLGSFGFVGDRVFEPVKLFSGGEKSRLALALLIWQQPNLLLLDEPTNHLDLEMRQALTLALQEFEGAMILVTHDRFLVRTTVDQLMLAASGEIKPFDGDLDDYQQWLFDFRRSTESTTSEKTGVSRKNQRQEDAKRRELLRPLTQQIKQLELELDKSHRELTAIEAALGDPALYEPQNKSTLQDTLLTQASLKKQIESIENAWLTACEKRDELP